MSSLKIIVGAVMLWTAAVIMLYLPGVIRRWFRRRFDG